MNFLEDEKEVGIRVRAVLGVPEEILTDEIISSPVFITKAQKYLNTEIENYSEEQKDMINVAYIYYIAYLLCPGMYARLPQRMENLSTKTLLQSIDWNEKSYEMLNFCNETIDQILKDLGDEESYYPTYIGITDASEYPNTTNM